MWVVGCGGSSPHGTVARAGSGGLTPAELKLQRDELVVVGRGLQSIEGGVRAEAVAARAAWPLIAKGLPKRISAAMLSRLRLARTLAGHVEIPRGMGKNDQIPGPAGGIAALLRSFSGLSRQGWSMTEAALVGMALGPAASARFMRDNVGLYITCLYDGHYNLAAIGETLQKAYVTLGGPREFGARLTQREVDGLARVYSPAVARLQPRPGPGLAQ
jgi:hypothetical protein